MDNNIPPNIILITTIKLNNYLINNNLIINDNTFLTELKDHLPRVINYITTVDNEINILNNKNTSLQKELTELQLKMLKKLKMNIINFINL